MSSEQYPEDEFDQAGRDVTIGVHRRKPSQWKSVLPFVLVLILAPLLAWGAATLYVNRSGGESQPSASASSSTQISTEASPQAGEDEQSAEPTQAESEPSAQPSATPTTSEDQATGDREATILVLNGTGTNGLAGGAADKLRQDGYHNVNAENADGWISQVSVIYYQPGKEALAKHVGEVLGISELEENGEVVGNNAAIVLLRGDYSH